MTVNTVDDVANATGICLVLDNSQSADTIELEVMDDIEGEQETCGELLDDKDNGDVGTDADTKEVLANIQAASKGVKEGTAAAYDSVMIQFNTFLAEEKVVPPGTDIFTERILHPKIDYYIVSFIMQGCDNVDMHGVSKAPHEPQKSYSHAQKLRASTTYGFRKGGRGKVPWDRAKVSRNPSISDVVSSYMLGLRKRKVAKGEIPTSTRAISPGTLWRFYDHNHAPENWNASPETPGNWCGGNMRKLLQAVYLITFTCLLQIDEALKIQVHDIEFGIDDVDGTHFVSITLPFHKSSPFGDIPPFILCALPKHMAHLCPVRALADWIAASKIIQGYLFLNIDKHDRPITVKNTAMKPEVFLQLFRNNLCDLGELPYAYGTHSFRRGGCQWLSVDLRWSICQICEWGGWSTDFTHLTIVKYLISWNDAATLRRDEFFKLDREATTRCWSCGRTCACA
ncbi:hypothetical protein IW261DRAFT_1670580 [Armillaria novae-zelandiae]|uniref:Tyr recombinase domain-containing protein n=1 Tax=Armillaria novae-zelandiae TaxID=153914 RepID=A0AA39U646_9AGAR|nr:hypothetical protein IW261DRAFT_1670580 [Armillaria novae-zelandiae]